MSCLMQPVCALWFLVAFVGAAGDSPVTLESLMAEHAAHAAALGTLETLEQVEVQVANSNEFQRRVIELGAERRREAQRKAFYRDVDLNKLTPEQRAKLEQQFEQAHPRADVALKVAEWKANEQRSLVQFGYYDFGSRRVRIDQTDQRDLPEVAQRFGIPPTPAHLLNLDQTRTDIYTPSYWATVRPAYGDDKRELVAVDKGSPDSPLDERLQRMGIIPRAYWDAKFERKLSTAPDGSLVLRGNLKASDRPAFEFTLDAGAGHFITRAVHYDGDGKRTLDLVVEDFRSSGRVTIPFHTESTKFFPSMGDMVQIERRLIEHCSLGSSGGSLPDNYFVGPSNSRVQTLDSGAADAYREFQKKLAAAKQAP